MGVAFSVSLPVVESYCYSHGEWWWFFEGEWWLYVRHTVRPACCYVRFWRVLLPARWICFQAFARSGMGIETGAWYPWSPMGVDTQRGYPESHPPTDAEWEEEGPRGKQFTPSFMDIYAHVAQNAAGVQSSLHGKEHS